MEGEWLQHAADRELMRGPPMADKEQRAKEVGKMRDVSEGRDPFVNLPPTRRVTATRREEGRTAETAPAAT